MGNHFSAERAGREFRGRIATGKILPLIGIYDVFSAKIAAGKFEGIFCSGFSYAASAYGLPDVGFVNWRDIIDFSMKIRHVIPDTHILVDIDDGFGDQVIASSVVKSLELNGMSAVVMEDQKRPRKCGHADGKELLPITEYLLKLKEVLSSRESLFIIARTDATDAKEGLERAIQYADAGADGVMVEAIRDLALVKQLKQEVECPIMINQLHGGKSPSWRLDELEDMGVSIVIYSTPCLFSAHYAIDQYLNALLKTKILPAENSVTMDVCNEVLYNHLKNPI